MDEQVKQKIENDIKNNKVVLYMKGTANMPMCGFSSRAVSILNEHKVTFKDINVLDHEDIRQGIKEYSEWPTIPQVYINGEFVGGSDILMEMHESGELTKLLGQ
jgi:monothiol glutaredoxin